jgi:hypothetical protein
MTFLVEPVLEHRDMLCLSQTLFHTFRIYIIIIFITKQPYFEKVKPVDFITRISTTAINMSARRSSKYFEPSTSRTDSDDLDSIFSTDSDVISEFCDKHGEDLSDPSRDDRSHSTGIAEDPLDALYKEQKTVRGARCIFLVILFIANAGALSWVIYWVSINGEQQDFGTQVSENMNNNFVSCECFHP